MRDSYRTKSGGVLVLPPKAKEHLEAHPEVGGLLEEVCNLLELPTDGSFVAREVDLGRIVGRSGRVSVPFVSVEGKTTFALRMGRSKASRVAVGAKGKEVSTVVVVASAVKKETAGTYALITAYVGDTAPKEPWGTTPGPEREQSLAFWTQEAMVYDPVVMGPPFVSSWREVIGE